MLNKKIEKNSFGMSSTTKGPLNLSVDHIQPQVVDFGATKADQNFVFPMEKKDMFKIQLHLKKIAFQNVN